MHTNIRLMRGRGMYVMYPVCIHIYTYCMYTVCTHIYTNCMYISIHTVRLMANFFKRRHICIDRMHADMGWLRLVGSFKL